MDTLRDMDAIDSELRKLLTAMRDETISAGELQRLEQRLSESAGDREVYLRYQQLHSLLEVCPPPAEVGDDSIRQSSVFRPRVLAVPVWLGAAAAIVLGIGMTVYLKSSQAPPINSAATILFAEGCEWKDGKKEIFEGQSINPGPLWLRRGSAVLRFAGGAELVLTDDSRIELVSGERVRLVHGEVVVRAEDGAEGFTVLTPEGDIIDLGTEFAVKVDDSGATELHVHEGEVAVKEAIVTAGNAVRMDQKSDVKMALDAPRFSEVVQQANPRERRDLMNLYEGFHVEEGTYEPSELMTGKGWSGPWKLRTPEQFGKHGKDTSTKMKISYGRMEIAWPVKGGRFGMLEFPPGNDIRLRQFAEPIDFSRDGITYLSFLAAEVKGDSAKPEIDTKREDFRLTFRSSTDYKGESLSIGWSKRMTPRVQIAGGVVRRAIREIPSEETVFCVAKINRYAKSPDRIQFRFYRERDHLDRLEPADWDVELSGESLSDRLDLLLITSEGNHTRFVDEIRMGPTWRSVTPIKNDDDS